MRKLIGPAITITTFLGCLVVAEFLLAFFAPVIDPYAEFKRELNQFIKLERPPNYSVVTEAEEGLPGMEGRHVFSTNNKGFRGDYLAQPKPPSEFRAFMIGGSTTECFLLDDSQTVSAILQKRLQRQINSEPSVKVYNAGISGAASDDHVSILVHRIVHLEPDMIVLFSGINDLTRSILNHDYLHYLDGSHEQYSTSQLLRFLTTEFQIPRRIYYALKKISPENDRFTLETITIKSNYRSKVKLRKSKSISDEKPRVDVQSYSRNLKTIVGVANTHNLKLIFVTQQTTWNSTIDPAAKDWHWMLYRWKATYREEFMDEAVTSLNEAMRQVSREHSVPIYDLSRSIPKSLEFFYDDVHFNVRGASFLGAELGSFILQSRLISHALLTQEAGNQKVWQ